MKASVTGQSCRLGARTILKQSSRAVCCKREFMKPINSAARRYFKPAAFALALMALCFLVAIVIHLPAPPKPLSPAPGPTALSSGCLDSRVARYFQSGQWRSDVHTLVNMIAYLVRPDPSPLTNQPPLHVEAQAGLVSPAPTQS
jgi:hypothetical protein